MIAEVEPGTEKSDAADSAPETSAPVPGTDAALAVSSAVPGASPQPPSATRAALPQAPASAVRPTMPRGTKASVVTLPAGEKPAAGETRTEAPIAITARVEPAMAAPVVPVGASAGAATSEPSTPARPKTLRPAEAPRTDAPAQQHFFSSPALQPEQAPSGQAAPAAMAPASPTPPSPADITAALDHLAAAREALMPAEAALAIEHAEFGEVSIRFEQSSEGQLSVELAAADPELQRAVTAAVGAERGLATATEGDSGRAAGQPSQRGPGPGADGATGDGAQPRHDRDGAPRRGPAQSRPAARTTDTHAGVFA